MSGGVDSSVAAALCVEAGHRVLGVSLRLWSEPSAHGQNRCCDASSLEMAARVADRLGIPYHVLDASTTFYDAVVRPFLSVSARGETPNPCFACNAQVRFGHLLAQVRRLGATAIATGHYARTSSTPDGAIRLLRGLDRTKDQSYMLHRLSGEQLAACLFPVGHLRKSDVRALADELGLPVADRAESMDLCWLSDDGLAGFLERNLPPGAAGPGPVLDLAGSVIGEHRGLPYYTVGQRRGLPATAGAPAYVVEKDTVRNALVVGPASALDRTVVRVREMHWISGAPDGFPVSVEAQVRHGAAPAPAVLEPDGARGVLVRFDEPQRAPTPGQGLVVYQGDWCLGGGTIA